VRRALLCLLFAACSEEPDPDFGVTCGDGVREEFENCDDGNRLSGDGCDDFCQPEPLVTMRWAFYPALGGPPLATGCRADAAIVELVTEVNTTKRYPCDDGRMGTVHLPLGKRIFARLRGPTDEIVAESLPVTAPSTWIVDADFYGDAGYLRATVDCTDAYVDMIFTPVGGGRMFIESTRCSGSGGGGSGSRVTSVVSNPVRAGDYDVEVRIVSTTRTRTGITIRPNNGVTDVDFTQ